MPWLTHRVELHRSITAPFARVPEHARALVVQRRSLVADLCFHAECLNALARHSNDWRLAHSTDEGRDHLVVSPCYALRCSWPYRRAESRLRATRSSRASAPLEYWWAPHWRVWSLERAWSLERGWNPDRAWSLGQRETRTPALSELAHVTQTARLPIAPPRPAIAAELPVPVGKAASV